MERTTLGREISSSEYDALSQESVDEVHSVNACADYSFIVMCKFALENTENFFEEKTRKYFMNTIVLKMRMEFRQRVLVLLTINLGKTPDSGSC